jgi:hypothetical protein
MSLKSLGFAFTAVAIIAATASSAATTTVRQKPSASGRALRRVSSTVVNCVGGTKATGTFVGGSDKNSALQTDAAVLGGKSNVVHGACSSIAGGTANSLDAYSNYSFIGAGQSNSMFTETPEDTNDSFIGAGRSNQLNSQSSAIAGGDSNSVFHTIPSQISYDNFIGAGSENGVYGDLSAVAAGFANKVSYGSYNSFIGSGSSNTVTSFGSSIASGANNALNGDTTFVGSGEHNSVDGQSSGIVAGESNNIASASFDAFVGSGGKNNILSNSQGNFAASYSAIVGGLDNKITSLRPGGAEYGFIGGGQANLLSGINGVIAGGQYNQAIGDYSTVPGGQANVATGVDSYAAGNGSRALHTGTFVWSDASRVGLGAASTAPNQFIVRASGGIFLYSSANLTSGVRLSPGSGSWASLSDRASKSQIVALDPMTVLAKVEALPVSEWSYRSENSGIRHVGPMAQDFYAAFGVGEDNRHITSIDEEGVAFSAIKGLARENSSLRTQLLRVIAREDALAARSAKLEAKVAALLARAR